MGVPVTIQVQPGPAQLERRARSIEVTFTGSPPQIVRAFGVAEAVGAARAAIIERDPYCGRMARYLGAREV